MNHPCNPLALFKPLRNPHRRLLMAAHTHSSRAKTTQNQVGVIATHTNPKITLCLPQGGPQGLADHRGTHQNIRVTAPIFSER